MWRESLKRERERERGYGAKIAGASPLAPARPTKSCVPLPSFFSLPLRQILVPRLGFFLDAHTFVAEITSANGGTQGTATQES